MLHTHFVIVCLARSMTDEPGKRVAIQVLLKQGSD